MVLGALAFFPVDLCAQTAHDTESRPHAAPATAVPDSTEVGVRLRAARERLLNELDGAQVGVLLVDVHTGRRLDGHQPDARFVPASNQKLLVTAAALSMLGPDFRYQTTVRTSGSVASGNVVGDLVVCGSGDPTMSRRFDEVGSDAGPLAELASQVVAAGVHTVTGRLIVDASRWDSARVPDSWMSGDLTRGYAATGGVFVVDEGRFDVIVDSRGSGHEVTWRAEPMRFERRIAGHVDRAHPTSSTRLSLEPIRSSRWRIGGAVAPQQVDTLGRAVAEPVAEAGAALHDALGRAGVRVEGGLLIDWSGETVRSTCDEALVLARVESPPLLDIVQAVLEPSQNWIAEQLVRTLADDSEEGRPRGSLRGGLRRIEGELAAVFGVDSARIELRDGSGLSAYNLVTPATVAQLLVGARKTEWGVAFRDALAEPNEPGSTLEDRLSGLRGRVFAKTGTITHVNSLSGYVTCGDSSEWAFSVLTNVSGRPSNQVRDRIDHWLRDVADVCARGG